MHDHYTFPARKDCKIKHFNVTSTAIIINSQNNHGVPQLILIRYWIMKSNVLVEVSELDKIMYGWLSQILNYVEKITRLPAIMPPLHVY